MKNFLFLCCSLVLFSGCGTVEEPLPEPEIDMSNFYAQVCSAAEGPCTNMACSLQDDTYQCAESISDMGKNCGTVQSMDNILDKYQLCGENLEGQKIFNYAQNLETLNFGTPAELEKKIAEETQIVENGGSSSFMSTLMASMGGAVLGGLIANSLFGQKNAMPPRQPASAYEQPYKKENMDSDKKGATANQSKVTDSANKTKAKSTAKTAAAKKAAAKKTTTTKKSSSSRKRR